MKPCTVPAIVAFPVIMLVVMACGGEASPPPNTEATVEAKVQAELATVASVEARVRDQLAKAVPTPTLIPTPVPTLTPNNVPAPTSTPYPTYTPLPTYTPQPAETPVPPTATPTPISTQVPLTAAALPYSNLSSDARRYIDIDYDKPHKDFVQEIVVATDVPKDVVDEWYEIQQNLNQTIGSYNRYVMLITTDNEHSQEVFEKLDQVHWTGPLDIKDGHLVDAGCLTGSGRWNVSPPDPYDLCIMDYEFIQYPHETRQWGSPKSFRQAIIYHGWAHEYFHRYQRAYHRDLNMGQNDVGTPAWWIEGAAILFPNIWLKNNWQEFSAFRGLSFSDVDVEGIDLERWYRHARRAAQGESFQGDYCNDYVFGPAEESYDTMGCFLGMANAYLAYLTSYETVWVHIPMDIYELGFEKSFQKHVGMTLDSFYDQFNLFLNEGNPNDPPPQGFFLEGPISSYVNFPMPDQVVPTVTSTLPTPTQVPPTATPTQVPPADTPVFVLGGIRHLTCQEDTSLGPIKTFPDGSLNDSGDPSKKYECANDDGMSTTDRLQKMIDNGVPVEVVLRTAGDKPRVAGPAVDYMKSIGLNKPKREPEHYYLFSDNIPQDFIDQHTEIHDYLIDIIGGYDRYVHITYELDGNNDSAIDTLNRIGLLNGNIASIDDVHEIRSCLGGFSAFDNWDGKNNWSLCIQPNPLTDPFWEHDRKMFGLDKYRYGVFHGWIHEYFHHYQKSHIFDRAMAMPNDCCGLYDPVGAPAWWVEGAAIVFPDLFMNEYFYVLNYTNTNQFKFSDGGYPFIVRSNDGEARNRKWDEHYKETRKLMRSTSHDGCTGVGSDEEYRDTAKCNWFLMNVYLAYITSYQTLFVDLLEDMWELGFDGSFQKHVGMTKEEFYESFNTFMREGDSDDPPPTGFFPDKPISELVDFWSIDSG